MKTITKLPLQIKAFIISTIIISTLFITMASVYGFHSFM